MTYFPAAIPTFTTKIDIYDVLFASHVNGLQNEVVAIASSLGVNPHVSPVVSPGTSFITAATTHATLGARLSNIENGVAGDSHTQYAKTAGGSTILSSATGVVGLNVRAMAAQTANILECRNSAGTVVFAVTAAGAVEIGGVAVATPADVEELKSSFYLGGDLP